MSTAPKISEQVKAANENDDITGEFRLLVQVKAWVKSFLRKTFASWLIKLEFCS